MNRFGLAGVVDVQVPSRLIKVGNIPNRGREETVIQRWRWRWVFLPILEHSVDNPDERNDCAEHFIKVLVPIKHMRTLEHSVIMVNKYLR
jgi:hypothetical protein